LGLKPKRKSIESWNFMIIKPAKIKKTTTKIDDLITHISPSKLERMRHVLAQRTRHVTLVTEEMHYPYNASAVIRSAECFGIQDIHIVQKRNAFCAYTGIARGSHKWTTLNYYRSTQDCYAHLKEKGYRIVATSPHAQATLPRDISLDTKIALVFGNEAVGLSPEALAMADEFIAIPMLGFTESLNVSVCVSICLYDVMQKLRTGSVAWQLSGTEQEQLLAYWVRIAIDK